ncbi:CHAP domain-containing protein [Staphylococcus devriesei]|uniref:CHAP domain-containing protein n=1 Tax=Staphylococcus devriesei TaxID=586733 RepID=A0A2K4DNM9_9STAP|nr:CHAP domain-containing protein [Staphylococcus devriesei]MCE5097065.1 CHAP domain-containing protein [Staphylococcus devriesei]PNZ88114.1 CHAP domain-containing protein [Staphylococcus devriesei]PTE74303.1 CHAP domain-containing protein [Staphylococcus devriesei]PTF04930.1 CHAP domain-containing protein [Staphylococcus devriesei]PTF14887.1 CHAP domain-containing protein [Staphylococcus devriesei]
MKKIATATIATAGIATFGLAHHDAQAAENNNGYNPNDQYSYSYTYTIDQQGNYHYDWKGNWSPSQAQQGGQQNSGNQAVNNTQSNNNYTYNNAQATTNNTQSYTANNNNGGGLGASYTTSDRNIKVTTQNAPTSQSTTKAFAGKSSSGANLYTAGQCTYYVYEKAGNIGNTWGNANNWATAAAQDGYSVSNSPKAGAVMQTSQGAYGHVAYVENVNSDGSVEVSEMNYNGGPGVVSTRTISASQASSYNYIS